MIRSVESSVWTADDRALMLARAKYVKTLCPGCGHPKATAWGFENDGWFDGTEQRVICNACTAMRTPDKDGHVEPVEYVHAIDTRITS